jgi:hypothetical protein
VADALCGRVAPRLHNVAFVRPELSASGERGHVGRGRRHLSQCQMVVDRPVVLRVPAAADAVADLVFAIVAPAFSSPDLVIA